MKLNSKKTIFLIILLSLPLSNINASDNWIDRIKKTIKKERKVFIYSITLSAIYHFITFPGFENL